MNERLYESGRMERLARGKRSTLTCVLVAVLLWFAAHPAQAGRPGTGDDPTLLALVGASVSGSKNETARPVMSRVTFKSDGVDLVGSLYMPPGRNPDKKHPAIVVVGPWTQVKEQTATTYAKALASSGFVTLAFDFRFFGESGGEPREYESPPHKIKDIRAAVAYLRTVSSVDSNRIGALGVCFGAGYVVAAAGKEPGIRSIATVAAWLHDEASLKALFGTDEVNRRRTAGEAALKRYESTGEVEYVPAHSTSDKAAAMFNVSFYSDPKRGQIPQWKNRFAVLSWPGWLDFGGLPLASKVKVPLMVMHSDGSALPGNVRRFFDAAAGPKELCWTRGDHTDFYDRDPYVANAVSALVNHFSATLVSAKSSQTSPSVENSGGPARRVRSSAPKGVDRTEGKAASESASKRANLSESSGEPKPARVTAVQVARKYLLALERKDLEAFMSLWADDGVQEMPYAPEGLLPKKWTGREEIRRQYSALPTNFTFMRFPITAIHETSNPEVAIVEFRGEIEIAATRKRYDNTYVGVFRIKEGKITHYTEYFDPIIYTKAFGNPPATTKEQGPAHD